MSPKGFRNLCGTKNGVMWDKKRRYVGQKTAKGGVIWDKKRQIPFYVGQKTESRQFMWDKLRQASFYVGQIAAYRSQPYYLRQRKKTMKKTRRPPGNILRCNNDMCSIPLLDMTSTEANIFMTTCYKYQHVLWDTFYNDILPKAEGETRVLGETEEQTIKELFGTLKQEEIPSVVLSFREIRDLINYKKKSIKRLSDDIRRMNEKLFCLSSCIVIEGTEGRDTEQFSLFNTLRTSETNGELTVQIDRRFARMLFDIERTYTDNEISEFCGLDSIYSKHLYRQLKRWNSKGEVSFTINDFKRLMCIPESYNTSAIKKRVLTPAVDECSEHFKNLAYELIYERNKELH